MDLNNLENLELVDALSFIVQVGAGEGEFATEEWDSVEDMENGMKNWIQNHPDLPMYFLVDFEKRDSDILVIEIPKNHPQFWQMLNEFLEAWGTGDSLVAIEGTEWVRFNLWFD